MEFLACKNIPWKKGKKLALLIYYEKDTIKKRFYVFYMAMIVHILWLAVDNKRFCNDDCEWSCYLLLDLFVWGQ